MEKLPISIGILSWKSGQTLVNTLTTYHNNGLLNCVNDICILFQEFSDQDKQIAEHFNLPYIAKEKNIGIGKAFIELTNQSKTENVLILEHDWKLIEENTLLKNRLQSGINMLEKGYKAIRYRHRKDPGYPHFSFQYQGRELDYYDKEIEVTSPHLLDSVHWCDPAEKFPQHIQKEGEYFTTTSRYGNWTNNPTLYKKNFYINTVNQFAGGGIDLEGNISKWWAQQSYKVAHGEGLFKHIDEGKHGR
tara:strand:- start:6723 stop:7463 length:741 start_codon:yes stop_codon:yes gene_type:complete